MAVEDAPNYREATPELLEEDIKCSTCVFAQGGRCEKYDFTFREGWVCDAWDPNAEHPYGKDGRTMDDATKVEDLQRTIDDLIRLADDLDGDDATKAGRRNRASDQAIINSIASTAADLLEMAVALGADVEDEMEGGEVEMMKALPPAELPTVEGGELKAISDGDRIGGYAVLFGKADEHDISVHRDYFTKATDFWLEEFGWPRPMTYHHGQHERDELRQAPIVGRWTKATVDDVGVFLEGELSRAHKYYGAVKELARRGLLKLSSDSAPQWVVRERQPNGAHEIKRWPLLTASPTVTPAEPRLAGVSFKALLAELGLDAIDDSPEASEPEAAEVANATKAAEDDRARRLALELELLALETA